MGLLVLALCAGSIYLWARDQPGQVVAFAGSDRRVSDEFDGAQATTVFGGYKLDLRDSEMRGHRAVLDLTTVFGGSQILVPDDWDVVYEGRAIFGGFEDKTHHPAGASRELIVEGLTLFGGTQIRN
jgi:Cell wall-active antibiotics response 4TMS YvqF